MPSETRRGWPTGSGCLAGAKKSLKKHLQETVQPHLKNGFLISNNQKAKYKYFWGCKLIVKYFSKGHRTAKNYVT